MSMALKAYYTYEELGNWQAKEVRQAESVALFLQALMRSVAQVFALIDKDSSGSLDADEVKQATGILGASLGFVLSAEEVSKLYRRMDIDGDGLVRPTTAVSHLL